MKQTIVLAGATGFIGRWIIEEFQDEYQIIALSRKKVKTNPNDKIIWRTVDLYSMSSTEKALEGADLAIYLVHSMQPSTRLNQGKFEDTDLLLADNFSRAAQKNKLNYVIDETVTLYHSGGIDITKQVLAELLLLDKANK